MNPIKTSAKDFFLNLGAVVALYTVAISLLNLLFTVINNAFPETTSAYYYGYSSSISWPVAVLIIFFPIFILLMWLLERGYVLEPEKRGLSVKRWLTYITLFIAGLAMAIDLVTVLYKFLDGQNITAAFFLKILSVLVIAGLIFYYFISELRNKLTASSRKGWAIVAAVLVLLSISWGFYVIGSPRTQRLIKYDIQRTNDLQSIQSAITTYYSTKGVLPDTLGQLSSGSYYYSSVTDPQTNAEYEYIKTSTSAYSLCAVFNKSTKDSPSGNTRPYGYDTWTHPEGRYCFNLEVNPNIYKRP